MMASRKGLRNGSTSKEEGEGWYSSVERPEQFYSDAANYWKVRQDDVIVTETARP